MTDWPYRAIGDLSEVINSATGVMSGETTEQRFAYRNLPRIRSTLSHASRGAEVSEIEARARLGLGGAWRYPIWMQQERVTGLTSGLSTVTVSTATMGLQVGADVFIWRAFDNYVVREVQSFDGSSITFTATLGQDFSHAWIIPAATGQMITQPAIAYGNGSDAEVSVTFVAQHYISPSAYGYSDLDSLPFVTDADMFPASISGGVKQDIDFVDNNHGVITPQPTFELVQRTGTASFSARTKADRWSLREFLIYLRGPQKAFWLPSMAQDFDITASIGAAATVITASHNFTAEDITGSGIFIRLNDGTTFGRRITGSGSGLIGFTPTLGQSVSQSDIETACLAHKVRASTNSIELSARGVGGKASFPVVEVSE